MARALQRWSAAFLLCAAASAWPQPILDGDRVLTREGLSLYTFDNDVVGSGKSVCNAACAGVFPAFLLVENDNPTAPFSLVVRDDGSKQWAYMGRPLYKFYADEKPGDKGGDGMNRNTWHLARK